MGDGREGVIGELDTKQERLVEAATRQYLKDCSQSRDVGIGPQTNGAAKSTKWIKCRDPTPRTPTSGTTLPTDEKNSLLGLLSGMTEQQRIQLCSMFCKTVLGQDSSRRFRRDGFEKEKIDIHSP
ncbi:MAG: hypothetical protein Q9186_007592, partial [Xanthomendoza sp. 1 TL-2023]